MQSDKIKKFVKRFFESLECEVKERNNMLKIDSIPQRFEKFYGKQGPYYFYFDSSDEKDKTDKAELITKGSYLLSCMNKFLENKGETTLLKIKSEQKPEQLIKKRFEIRNCSISSVNQKKEHRSFERFTFMTTFQYLNKKEEIITKVFVRDGKEIDIDLKDFEIEEGKKRDVQVTASEDFKKDYNIAKSKLKKSVEGKIDLLKEQLSRSLEEEKARIKKHHEEQLKDDDKNIEDLKKQLDKAKSENKEKRDEKRIERLETQIKELQSKERRFELEKDKQASIDQEMQKHSLNIKNKLLNTTIIYYPVFRFEVWLKTTGGSKRLIYIDYDLFQDSFSELKCESCKKPVSEIILCSSGHLTCRECGYRCENCGDILCKKCSLVKCSETGKNICKKCSFRCASCGKTKTVSHKITESFQGKEICRNCSIRCADCGQLFSKKNIKTTKTGRQVCDRCYQKKVGQGILRSIR